MVQNEKIRSRNPAQTLSPRPERQKLERQKIVRLDSPLFRAMARQLLRSGTSLCFEARGLSMAPEIHDGDLLYVAPVSAQQLRCGEIVLVETGDGAQLRAHRLISADARGNRFVTRGDASQEPDAPVRVQQILGRITAKESIMNRIGGQHVMSSDSQGTSQRVELHGVRAQARRRAAKVRGVAAGWVKSALGMRAGAGVALLFLLLSLAVPASAQVTVDTSLFNGATTTSGSNFTITPFTAGASANFLVVGVSMNIGSNSAAQVSTLTYGFRLLTFLSAHNNAANTRRVEFWFLKLPATGVATTLTVTMNAYGAGSVGVAANAVSFIGVDQTDPVSASTFKDGTAATTSELDVPSANKELVYAIEATGGDFDLTKFGPAVQQFTGHTGAGTFATVPPDVSAGGYTLAGAPSVPIPVTFAAARATTNTSTAYTAGGISLHPSQADMSVTVTTNGAIYTGGTAIYSVRLQNNGWSDAANVSLSFPLAGGETFVSATAPCTQAAGTVTCNEGTIASAFGIDISIRATVAAAGNYTTTATVSSTTTDLYTSNNTFTVTLPVQTIACGTPGNDGAGGTLTGVINTYFPGTASAASGATSLTVGPGVGFGTSIANGDLLLIIQMQDATINTTNGATYGDGSGSGSGSTTLNGAGTYEYVRATGVFFPPLFTTFNIVGAGPGGGLIYSYTNAAKTNTQGQRVFQVIRVPQYTTATLSAGLTASAWNGATGGVLAFDVRDTLTLGGVTVNVNGLGFRGGGGLGLVGTAGRANTDFQNASPASAAAGTAGAHGSKGEGIAGTPAWVDTGAATATAGGAYPSGAAADGSMARGAPGNAGGGGTDSNPSANNQNSGGGGGANGGAGGAGGNSWSADAAVGGVGGAAFRSSINRVVLGGGGGSGSRNNSGTNASAGGDGGGIIMIRAGFLSGTATITSNGAAAVGPPTTINDGGGGGGAGGSIVILSQAGGEGGLTLSVNGGAGANTNAVAFTSFGTEPHGPGGGGGGGVIITSGSPSTNRFGGVGGTTSTSALIWGATAGAQGATPINSAKLSQVAGVRSGVECPAPDCVITKTHTGNFVRGSSGNIYTITVSNASANTAITAGNTVSVVDAVPVGLTATALTGGAGWTCTLGTLTCTNNLALAPGASYTPITLTVSVSATPPSSVTNVATVSGGGELQTNNDTANDQTNIIGTLLTISKSGAPNPTALGQNLVYTINIGNTGPNNEATATLTDPLPASLQFVSATATNGGVCNQAAGTVTCTYTPFNVGASSTITITTTTLSSATVTNVATLTDSDTNLDTVTATATTTTTFPTAVTLKSFSAERVGSGNVITWQTGGEKHNLGFNLYREENGARVKVNPSLIAGSALRMRETLEQHQGSTYAWPDAKSGTAYWLEDVEINGAKTLHGPVYPGTGASSSGASRQAITARAATLAEMSLASARAATASAASSSATDSQNGSPSGPQNDASRALPRFALAQAITAKQQQTQFGLAAHAAVKLALRTEGWYRVSQKQLVAAGLNPAVDPKFLHLYTEAIEQPIRITGAGSGPGGFGPNAAIEFYATGIDTPFSDTRIGWLVAGDTPGLRILEAGNAGGSNNALTSFPYAVELRQRSTFFAALLNGENNDNFFGAVVTSTPVDQVLTANGVADAASGLVQLEVALQGGTTGINHNVTVGFNGASIGAVTFSDEQQGKVLLDVPAGMIREGDNTVTLAAQNGDNDVSLVDHITLHYGHSYTAESDALRFTAPAGDHVQVTGFVAKPARLVDITNAAHPINLAVKVTGTAGAYVLDVNVPWNVSGTHTLLALGWSELALASASRNQPSAWHAPQVGSDIVMITHPSFAAALQPLVKLRQSQGKTVSVVSVDNLYDEFNFGERSPEALRDFLASASSNWKAHPQYLLLVGDATMDPRNYLGFGNEDFVPTRLVETFYLKTASDEWFSDFHNTGVGTIATGRLPVRTQADIQNTIRKIKGYDDHSNSGAWTKQVLLVADADAEGLGFAADTEGVKALLPKSLATSVVDGSQLGTPAARAQILSAINGGQLLVNYLGHGSVEVWGNGSLLADADAASLTNAKRLPVFLIMDCLNGYFHDVYTESMAESLLLTPNGGAVAVWSSSGLNDAPPQAELDKQVVQGLFSSKNITLGEAIQAAKGKVTVPDVQKTYILFGDPSMKLHP